MSTKEAGHMGNDDEQAPDERAPVEATDPVQILGRLVHAIDTSTPGPTDDYYDDALADARRFMSATPVVIQPRSQCRDVPKASDDKIVCQVCLEPMPDDGGYGHTGYPGLRFCRKSCLRAWVCIEADRREAKRRESAPKASEAGPAYATLQRVLYNARALSKRLEIYHAGAGPEYHCEEHASLADALQEYDAVPSRERDRNDTGVGGHGGQSDSKSVGQGSIPCRPAAPNASEDIDANGFNSSGRCMRSKCNRHHTLYGACGGGALPSKTAAPRPCEADAVMKGKTLGEIAHYIFASLGLKVWPDGSHHAWLVGVLAEIDENAGKRELAIAAIKAERHASVAAPSSGQEVEEQLTIGPEPDESRVSGYRIKGPWRATREAAERDGAVLRARRET